MLADLTVKNFALIEELTVSFGPGFNVLTGETGAGKSIIVGAINLILGGRAASDLIRAGTDEAEVQAVFLLSHPETVQHRLAKLGLPGGAELVIRRVLPRRGRNRIFINGALATLTQLSALGRDLIAVSGQHEHQRLLDPEQQILYLDQFGGLSPLRAEMGLAHEALARLKTEVSRLEQRLQEAREKADLTQFQRREIEAAGLALGEDEVLEKEKELAGNAEKIFSLVGQSYDRLYGESGSVIEALDAVRSDLERAAVMDERLADTSAQVQAAFHEIDDAAQVLRGHLDRLTFDPARLEEIEDRLALINRLKRKYGPLLEDVLNYGREAAGRMDRLAGMERGLEDRRSEAGEARQRARALAGDLSAKRKAASVKMSRAVALELRSLGMPRLEFDICVTPASGPAEPGPLGWDEVEFMISPNVGEDLKPLARIASGGELSRAMLGLQGLLAGQERVGTIIFDEVDAGIGGAVAEVIGRKLKELASFHQVICITHLPQIAAFGQNHHQVFKEVRDQRTVTGIRPLSKKEVVAEIARMVGGLKPTDKIMATAGEMIAQAKKGSDS